MVMYGTQACWQDQKPDMIKRKMYIIKKVDDTYVYLVDGRIRTLVHPKKKKKKTCADRSWQAFNMKRHLMMQA